MLNGLQKTLIILLLLPVAAVAEMETVYVHDQLRLGVRAAPDTAEKSIAVVKTGDALSVLGEQDNFINIRTESGLEGWVSKGYVSTEPPAQNLLKAAQQELDALKEQHNALTQKFEEGAKEAEQQQAQLAQLQSDSASLQEKLGAEVDGESHDYDVPPVLLWLALLLVCFLAGLVIGVRWKTRRVAERIGGLRI